MAADEDEKFSAARQSFRDRLRKEGHMDGKPIPIDVALEAALDVSFAAIFPAEKK